MNEYFLINPVKPKRAVRKRIRKTSTRPRPARTGKRNPFAEEVLIVGNPKRRKRRVTKTRRNPARARARKRVYKRRRRNPLVATQAPKRRVYRRRNAPKRRRRSYRRNAPRTVARRSLQWSMTMIAPVLAGVAAKMAVERVPVQMGLVGNQKLLAQVGVSIVGGLMLQRVVGKTGALVFMSTGLAVSLSGLIENMLAKATGGDLGYYGYPAALPNRVSSYPDEGYALDAFPTEFSPYGP